MRSPSTTPPPLFDRLAPPEPAVGLHTHGDGPHKGARTQERRRVPEGERRSRALQPEHGPDRPPTPTPSQVICLFLAILAQIKILTISFFSARISIKWISVKTFGRWFKYRGSQFFFGRGAGGITSWGGGFTLRGEEVRKSPPIREWSCAHEVIAPSLPGFLSECLCHFSETF